jgi:hypothetical protein
VADTVPFKYRAFVSYSHRDKGWAEWLHAALEKFRIDPDLVGRTSPAGPVPRHLRPIFRDREDFSAGHSLTEQTLAALEASQFLIAICSPNAVKSHYVNEEIRHFKAIGRGARVIAVIVDGEPGDAERECFPPALRVKIAPDGTTTKEPEEPIAAVSTRPNDPIGDCWPSSMRSRTAARPIGPGSDLATSSNRAASSIQRWQATELHNHRPTVWPRPTPATPHGSATLPSSMNVLATRSGTSTSRPRRERPSSGRSPSTSHC